MSELVFVFSGQDAILDLSGDRILSGETFLLILPGAAMSLGVLK